MRSDMFKVIVERPRKYDGIAKGGRMRDLEDLPLHESMRARHVRNWSGKILNENLAPLRRFLQSRVGKKWDKVYSEICENLNGASTVQQHVKDHVFDFVCVNVVLDAKGKPLRSDASRGIYHDFWVHPKTGILMKTKETRRRWTQERREREAKELAARQRIIGPEKELHKLDGVWYWAVFADRPPLVVTTYKRFDGEVVSREHLPTAIDVVTGELVPADRKRYRKGKRQASSRDLAAHGLANDAREEPAGKKPRLSKWAIRH